MIFHVISYFPAEARAYHILTLRPPDDATTRTPTFIAGRPSQAAACRFTFSRRDILATSGAQVSPKPRAYYSPFPLCHADAIDTIRRFRCAFHHSFTSAQGRSSRAGYHASFSATPLSASHEDITPTFRMPALPRRQLRSFFFLLFSLPRRFFAEKYGYYGMTRPAISR